MSDRVLVLCPSREGFPRHLGDDAETLLSRCRAGALGSSDFKDLYAAPALETRRIRAEALQIPKSSREPQKPRVAGRDDRGRQRSSSPIGSVVVFVASWSLPHACRRGAADAQLPVPARATLEQGRRLFLKALFFTKALNSQQSTHV